MTAKTKSPASAATLTGGKARRDGLSASNSYSTTRARFVCRGQFTFLFDSALPNPSDLARFKNQRADVISYMLDGHSLTQDEAQYLFSIRRLASRISELKSDGWSIYREMIFVGEGTVRVARYWLDREKPRVDAMEGRDIR